MSKSLPIIASLLLLLSCTPRHGGSYSKGEAVAVASTAAVLATVQVVRAAKARNNGVQQGDCCQVCDECTFPCGNACVPDGTLCAQPPGCACAKSASIPDPHSAPPNPIHCKTTQVGIVVY